MRRKTVRTILLCIIMVLCFTGCIRHEAIVEFKTNGKVDITMVYATAVGDKEMSSAADEKAMQELEELGWECKTYKQDNFEGYECTKRDVDIDDFSHVFDDSEDLTQLSSNGFEVTKNGTNYVVDWALVDQESHEQMKQYGPVLTQSGGYLRITMKFPNKPKQHNATEVSENGKTLTWDVLTMEPGETAHVEFSLSKVGLVIKLALIIAALIIAIIIFIILLKKIGKNKDKTEPNEMRG